MTDRVSPWPMTVEGVLLREATEGDIEEIVAFRNDPRINEWMIRVHEDPEALRATWRGIPTSERDHSCAVVVDGTFAGVGFLEIETGMGQPGIPRDTEGAIGYLLRPEFWGRGVGSAVARGLLAGAFETLGLRRVTAGCYADNRASARILEKAGMRREQHGIADSWHAERGWIDGYTYGMLAREWVPLRG